MRYYLSVVILILLISACGRKSGDTSGFEIAGVQEEVNAPQLKMEMSEADAGTPAPSPQTPQLEIRKKIIKNGRMGLKVTELASAKSRVDSLVKIFSGYYASENFSNNDYEMTYQLRIRVPCAGFERFADALERGGGEVQFKSIDAQDVTSEFVDLETRLDNKRNYLKRYNDLLKQAKSIREILDIEEKIRVLEEEIESTTGRLKYLSDQVDYSTLDLTITKAKEFKYKPGQQEKFWERLKQSLSNGWSGFVELILFLIKIWPLCLIGLAVYFVWRKRRKKRSSK